MAENAPTPTPTPPPASSSGAPAPASTPAPAPTPSPTPAPSDWRAAIKDEEARKFAGDSTDIEHLAKRGLEMRQKLATAIVRPGKDAKPDSPEVAAYRKAMDIPAEPKGYLDGIARPEHISEDDFKGERVQGILGTFAKAMFDAGAPKTAVQQALGFYFNAEAAILKAQVEDDKKYADSTAAALKTKWGAEYDKNKEFANRAAGKLFGAALDTVRKIEDRQGRYVLDNPVFVEAFAAIGREMGEGALGSVLTDAERNTIDDEIRTVRKQIEEAQGSRDSKRANELYQKEQALIAKKTGRQPIVGSMGRAA